ncbi:hypothetical protein ZIOFF_015615 [Zingiber officinale]|uniref:Uncharacterized protein n=1 Tax=Zingiber officinale TaxID=94328 RepID=A0A8J5HJL5_ZINOF|nr:hypothetical protein ZIOFF_015615 [Zingiber officinale]
MEDHVHVHETVVPGPHGQLLAAVIVDEDVVVRERLKKGEATAVAKASLGGSEDPTAGSTAGTSHPGPAAWALVLLDMLSLCRCDPDALSMEPLLTEITADPELIVRIIVTACTTQEVQWREIVEH